jgi:hypothetical protein
VPLSLDPELPLDELEDPDASVVEDVAPPSLDAEDVAAVLEASVDVAVPSAVPAVELPEVELSPVEVTPVVGGGASEHRSWLVSYSASDSSSS